MSRSGLALVVTGILASVAVGGCHLGDSPDAVTCEAGTHPSDGHCVLDAVTAVRVTILAGAGGASCVADPASIKVAPNAQFEFQNTDGVDHVIAGADGQPWATVKAGQLSPLVAITKAGSWPYTLSGCTNGGTVVVE
jgi:plastocyanin